MIQLFDYRALLSLILFVAAPFANLQSAAAAAAPMPFTGEKSSWHNGFDRYDYLMDDQTLAIQPFKRGETEKYGIKDPPQGKRRCVVIVPKRPAFGNPWSWRGCYWDHQPQVEVELLKRGFHVVYISANAALKPGKQWDAWYAFLTEKHGLSRKPAFVGMSRGGEYAYTWATANPARVACIYADNPGVNPDVLKKLGDLAAADVPILHVCGSIDPLLGRSATLIENIYQQFGGQISVMIKEGSGHHPHSLRDPKPIADFISQSVQPVENTPPAYVGSKYSKKSFYSIENSYRSFPKEGIYITCRGPWFTECYDHYSFTRKGIEGAIAVIVPKKAAPGKPWAFRADPVNREAVVDLALLANGFHIVTGPVPYNADGPSLQSWNAVYKLLTDNGFSRKPVLEGAGGAAGEAYAWAIANPDKVSCIYGENPILRCTMTKAQPLDNLATLARAGVPLLHVCGSLDPMLKDHTRAAEKHYMELRGSVTVIIQEGIGHYPTAPKDPKPVVEFILNRQGAKGGKPKTMAVGGSRARIGQYWQVGYPASTVAGELPIAVTYTLWIPDGVKQLRGVIVHQHGAGTTAALEGSTAAYDLHWQALARKWECALLGPSYHVKHDQNDLSPGGSELWFDPRRGSGKAFLNALDELGSKSRHPELARVPWILWGHSGGGIWADVMSTLHPERVVAMWLRSGSAAQFRTHPEFPQPQVPPACYAIPIMLNPGRKEEKAFTRNAKGLEKGPWWGNLATFLEYREHAALIGFAPDPRTDHECGDSRYLAIPYLNACLASRLPEKEGKDQTLKPMNTSRSWLAPLLGEEARPAAVYRGDLKEAVWLPNEAVAKAWMEYVKTGAISDTTPPAAPFHVKASFQGATGAEITWDAEADFESGLSGFLVLRDGKELATVPEKPVGRFGRPLFQSMTYHDTPAQPLPEMRYLDASAKAGEQHVYRVIALNSVGLKSEPSLAVTIGQTSVERPRRLTRAQIIEQTMKPVQGTSNKGVDCSTLTGKVMCGYQGWHAAEGDGCGRGWYHWTGRNGFKPGSTNVDLWPDVSELSPQERYATAFKTADGKTAEVYSAFNARTVIRHFKWMRDYGIDGVFVQRFAGEVFNLPGLRQFNTVLNHCREGANKYGRTYAVMYDLSGMRAGQMSKVMDDWKLLYEQMQITKDPAYLHHHGKPVVAVWGFGFSDGRNYTLQEGLELVAFLKRKESGACAVLLGVPTYWRTLDRDAVKDKTLLELVSKADIVSPWTVGRYASPQQAASYARKTMAADVAWCKENKKEYLPVVFPGFSWHNQNPRFPVNSIPRQGGKFLWSQFVAAKQAGATMIYQAMFDEVDEGTAIYKCTNDVPVGASKFATFEGLPSDHYLKLVGAASRMIRGEIPPTDEMPALDTLKK